MKPKILLIAHFCDDFDGGGNNRFNYLAELFSENDFDVEIITSGFSHSRKACRVPAVPGMFKYKITYINEPVYKKNVSLTRFYSHYVMGGGLKRYLEAGARPDLIYCAVPSLDAAAAAARYALANKLPFVVDVQDLWPEAFKMVFNAPGSDILFAPMQRRADFIYGAADAIVAVSQTYSDRALRVSKKCQSALSVYIGTDLQTFDRLAEQNKPTCERTDEIWLAYAGTLGHSYDLTSVIDALSILKNRGIENIKLMVMGDGPLMTKFEAHAKEADINASFTGRISYGEMCGILKACDLAVNPIRKGTAASIINKHGDYAAAGLPVLNTQETPEYMALVDDYNMGINCINGDLADKLLKLCRDAGLRDIMSKNSRQLAEERFNRKHSYKRIVELVRGLITATPAHP